MLAFVSLGDLPDLGMEPVSPVSPAALTGGFFTTVLPGNPPFVYTIILMTTFITFLANSYFHLTVSIHDRRIFISTDCSHGIFWKEEKRKEEEIWKGKEKGKRVKNCQHLKALSVS